MTRSPEKIERDAVFLWCAEHPFIRWREAGESAREKYRQRARRVREHMEQYEPEHVE